MLAYVKHNNYKQQQAWLYKGPYIHGPKVRKCWKFSDRHAESEKETIGPDGGEGIFKTDHHVVIRNEVQPQAPAKEKPVIVRII